MSEQTQMTTPTLPAPGAVEPAMVSIAADRLYQLAALTAGFLLLVSLL